jgi:hypothetical protein
LGLEALAKASGFAFQRSRALSTIRLCETAAFDSSLTFFFLATATISFVTANAIFISPATGLCLLLEAIVFCSAATRLLVLATFAFVLESITVAIRSITSLLAGFRSRYIFRGVLAQVGHAREIAEAGRLDAW